MSAGRISSEFCPSSNEVTEHGKNDIPDYKKRGWFRTKPLSAKNAAILSDETFST
jgi:hypothetical protein